MKRLKKNCSNLNIYYFSESQFVLMHVALSQSPIKNGSPLNSYRLTWRTLAGLFTLFPVAAEKRQKQ